MSCISLSLIVVSFKKAHTQTPESFSIPTPSSESRESVAAPEQNVDIDAPEQDRDEELEDEVLNQANALWENEENSTTQRTIPASTPLSLTMVSMPAPAASESQLSTSEVGDIASASQQSHSYQVVNGDTLWSIGKRLNPQQPDRFVANVLALYPELKNDPRRLRVGMRLTIPHSLLPLETSYVYSNKRNAKKDDAKSEAGFLSPPEIARINTPSEQNNIQPEQKLLNPAVDPNVTPSRRLMLRAGHLLSVELKHWTEQNNYQLRWSSNKDYRIFSDIYFNADLDSALAELAKLFNTESYGLIMKQYLGNRVLVIADE